VVKNGRPWGSWGGCVEQDDDHAGHLVSGLRWSRTGGSWTPQTSASRKLPLGRTSSSARAALERCPPPPPRWGVQEALVWPFPDPGGIETDAQGSLNQCFTRIGITLVSSRMFVRVHRSMVPVYAAGECNGIHIQGNSCSSRRECLRYKSWTYHPSSPLQRDALALRMFKQFPPPPFLPTT